MLRSVIAFPSVPVIPRSAESAPWGPSVINCAAHYYLNDHEKILKNLLNYPGSPRQAFGLPRDNGTVGMICGAFLWMMGRKRGNKC